MAVRPNIDCDQARTYLQFRLDGELTEADAGALAAHLAVCADCRAEAAGYEGLFALWQRREVVAPPADLAARIMAKLPGSLPRRQAGAPALRPRLLAPLLATSGGALLLLAWFLGELTAPATALLEGLFGAATTLWSDPLALWNMAPRWPDMSLAVTLEVLLTAGLGLLLISAGGIMALPLSGRRVASAGEGIR